MEVFHTLPSSASAAHICTPRCVHASAVVPHTFAPHFTPSACTQVPDSLRGFYRTSSSLYLVSLFSLPFTTPRCLVSRWVPIFAQGRGERAPPLPGNSSPLSPPPHYLATPEPSGYPPPPCCIYPILPVEVRGAWQ